ncbi:UNVERIFIED_CONTAM: hypothetical protein GTU68_018962 [Idotea baltica]|nr:hypothetical protein [Idotea baltica]
MWFLLGFCHSCTL